MTSVEILGVAVTTSSLDQVARDVVAWATGPRVASTPRYVCATSVHGLVEAARDPSFRAILNRAARVTPDGMPLVWFGRLRGRRAMGRVYGPALMKEVCRLTAGHPVRHFFYGGGPGVADELAKRLRAENPRLEVEAAADDESAELVRQKRPHLLLVAFGAPRQEMWIDRAGRAAGVPVAMGVGGSFDYLTGRVPRAPAWMRSARLEWLFRLGRQPWRLKRMAVLPGYAIGVLAQGRQGSAP